MASLSVRKLDQEIYEGLRIRAAKHGVSMEEEARCIIKQAVTAPEKLTTVFRKNFGLENGIDLDCHSQRNPHNPINFD